MLLLTYKRRKVHNALNRKWVYQNGLCIWYRDCIKLQKSGEDKQHLSWFSSKLSNERFVFIQCSEALFRNSELVAYGQITIHLTTWKSEKSSRNQRNKNKYGKGQDHDQWKKSAFTRNSGKHPSDVCRKGAGNTSSIFVGCELWLQKKWSEIKSKLIIDSQYWCKRCLKLYRLVNGRREQYVTWGSSKLYLVEFFRYLGDDFSPSDCKLSITLRTRVALGIFRYLFPLLLLFTILLSGHGLLNNSRVIGTFPAGNYMFKVNNRNTRKRCAICSN